MAPGRARRTAATGAPEGLQIGMCVPLLTTGHWKGSLCDGGRLASHIPIRLLPPPHLPPASKKQQKMNKSEQRTTNHQKTPQNRRVGGRGGVVFLERDI